MEPVFVLLGFLVGDLVGLTRMGGGALMTPSLIFLGIEPVVAVGTDLLYAIVTKVSGVLFHQRRNSIRVDLTSRLIIGDCQPLSWGAWF